MPRKRMGVTDDAREVTFLLHPPVPPRCRVFSPHVLGLRRTSWCLPVVFPLSMPRRVFSLALRLASPRVCPARLFFFFSCALAGSNENQYTSFIGVVSILYTVCFVVGRSLDGSYSKGGNFFGVRARKHAAELGSKTLRGVPCLVWLGGRPLGVSFCVLEDRLNTKCRAWIPARYLEYWQYAWL